MSNNTSGKRKHSVTFSGSDSVRVIERNSNSNSNSNKKAKDEKKRPVSTEEEKEEELTGAQIRAKNRDTEGDAHTLDSDDEDEEERIREMKRNKRRGEFDDEEDDNDEEENEGGNDEDDETKGGVDVDTEKYNLTEEEASNFQRLDKEFKDGGYAVTGFNMKDEFNEGHFDESGQFVWEKNKKEKADEWLDGVAVYKGPLDDEQSKPKKEVVVDRYALMEKIVKLMKPMETVADAIRRLGDALKPQRAKKHQPKSSKPKWMQNNGDNDGKPLTKEEREEVQQKLDELIHCADELLNDGITSIYEETMEKIELDIKQKDVVMFEFKWSDDAKAEVYGPYSAEQMLQWSEANYFKSGVWARETKKGPSAPFYHSSRIDFDLYID
eukprot:m.229484 g.229484  ORF g.229484 m.229484 type:complete len:382 (+) comp13884_c0_seq1:118-1263(+)